MEEPDNLKELSEDAQNGSESTATPTDDGQKAQTSKQSQGK